MAQGSATGGIDRLEKNKVLPSKMNPSGNVIPIQRRISHPRDIRTPLTDTRSMTWPIGSVFIGNVSTNPNTLLSFGTWTAIQSGIWASIGSVNLYIWQRTA
jgi:hypothetical protein